jgi:DNA primase
MSWADDLVSYAQGNLDDRVYEALWSRGVSSEPDQIKEFKLGYLNGTLPAGVDPAFSDWAHGGKKLKDSFVLPLTNPLGMVMGFQFRSVDQSNKGYLDYFLVRDEPVLFGLSQAIPHLWSTGSVCIVEGAFDLFPVQRVFPYTISTMTARITESLLRWLFRLVHKVYLFYDADSTGRSACREFTGEYRSDFEHLQTLDYPRGVILPNGKPVKDPGNLWEAWGDDQLKLYLMNQIRE